MELTREEVIKQSEIAVAQWRPLWVNNCAKNKGKISTRLSNLEGCFKAKSCFLFAYGPSFKQDVIEIKRLGIPSNPDFIIGCVDKACRPLIQAGIKPDFVLIADGVISAEKWLAGVSPEEIKNTILISNVYGNPYWSDVWVSYGYQDNIYWYLNKDNIKSEEIFGELVDYYDTIPAASNVGNSLCTVASIIMKMRFIYLCGFCYCWESEGNYYGTVNHAKRTVLGHERLVSTSLPSPLVWSSSNMIFSAEWLDQFISVQESFEDVIFYNCSSPSILKNGVVLELNKLKELKK